MVVFVLLTLIIAPLLAPGEQTLRREQTTLPVTYTVQGDSLTVPLLDYLAEERPDWRLVDFRARSGREVRQGWSSLRHQRLGRIVIFALGTNDRSRSATNYRRAIDRLLDHLGQDRCLVMATVYDRGAVERLNGVLRSAAADYGPRRMQLADWSREVELGRVRLADQIHAGTGPGNRWRSRLLLEAAERCL